MERLMFTRTGSNRNPMLREKVGRILAILMIEDDNLTFIEAKAVIEEVMIAVENIASILPKDSLKRKYGNCETLQTSYPQDQKLDNESP